MWYSLPYIGKSPPPKMLDRPLVELVLKFNSGTYLRPAFLATTGSNLIVAKQELLEGQNVRVTHDPPPGVQPSISWKGKEYKLKFTDVEMTAKCPEGTLVWPARIGLWDANVSYCLFGLSGGLALFDNLFLHEERLLRLRPNSHFVGKQFPKP